MISPTASGPPPAALGAGDGSRGAGGAIRERLGRRGEAAFSALVRRGDDRLLERTAAAPPGLRVLFGQMTQRYVPEKADGFAGEVQYDLRTTGGDVRTWTVTLGAAAATARPGPARDARLVMKLSLADFLRIAARDLDAGEALLTGRLDLEGDFVLATRLGEMFGQPSAF